MSRLPVDPTDFPENGESTCVLALSAFGTIGDEQRHDTDRSSAAWSLNSSVSPYVCAQRWRIIRYNMHRDGAQLLLLIPKHRRLTVLAQLHDIPTAGHLGVSRTYDRV